MEYLRVKMADGKLHIDGFPDGVAVVTLDGAKARRLSDLGLISYDLEFARRCLETIPGIPDDLSFAREGLWHAAIISFMKVFARGQRFRPNPMDIFRDDANGGAAYAYFDRLRDNHIAHDTNSYGFATPAAILNNGCKAFKVEKVACLTRVAITLDQANWNNLRLLIGAAVKWVEVRMDGLCDDITKDLEREPYDALIARKPAEVKVPGVEELAVPRPR